MTFRNSGFIFLRLRSVVFFDFAGAGNCNSIYIGKKPFVHCILRTMAELGEFNVTGDSKVHVDVEMLDYEYIEKCSDPQRLRAIVEVLKSGKEGFYPDVIPSL